MRGQSFSIIGRFIALRGQGRTADDLLRTAPTWAGYSGRHVQRVLTEWRRGVARRREIFGAEWDRREDLTLLPADYYVYDDEGRVVRMLTPDELHDPDYIYD